MKKGTLVLTGCLVLLFLQFAATGRCSQMDARKTLDLYDRESIYLYSSILGNGYVKNGQAVILSALGTNLAEEMAGSQYALEEMKKVRKYRTVALVTNVVGTSLSVAELILSFRKDTSLALDAGVLISSIVFNMIANGFNHAAEGAMSRAVWLYNRDVLSGDLEHN